MRQSSWIIHQGWLVRAVTSKHNARWAERKGERATEEERYTRLRSGLLERMRIFVCIKSPYAPSTIYKPIRPPFWGKQNVLLRLRTLCFWFLFFTPKPPCLLFSFCIFRHWPFKSSQCFTIHSFVYPSILVCDLRAESWRKSAMSFSQNKENKTNMNWSLLTFSNSAMTGLASKNQKLLAYANHMKGHSHWQCFAATEQV